MLERDKVYLNYYDGSSHVEFAEEIADGQEVNHNEGAVPEEDWRCKIGANPYLHAYD
jgi:hypothetical protein